MLLWSSTTLLTLHEWWLAVFGGSSTRLWFCGGGNPGKVLFLKAGKHIMHRRQGCGLDFILTWLWMLLNDLSSIGKPPATCLPQTTTTSTSLSAFPAASVLAPKGLQKAFPPQKQEDFAFRVPGGLSWLLLARVKNKRQGKVNPTRSRNQCHRHMTAVYVWSIHNSLRQTSATSLTKIK